MDENIVVVLNLTKINKSIDIEIPLDITARELIVGLNTAYELNIDTDDIKNCFLKIDNPPMLLRGNMVLRDTGIRNGSIINYTE